MKNRVSLRPLGARWQRAAAIGAAAIVTASVLQAVPAAAQTHLGPTPLKNHEIIVSGHSLADPTTAVVAASSSKSATTTVTGDGTTSQVTDLASPNASTTWKNLGSTGIRVKPVLSTAARNAAKSVKVAHPVTALTARVMSRAETKKLGLQGLVVAIKRTDASTTSAPIQVNIPNKTLAGYYGGDYASRIQWKQVATPADGATATTAVAQAKTLSVSRSASSQTVTANAASNQTLVAAAAASPNSSAGGGAYSATSLKPSDSWDVSAQTGDFSWSYPMRTPPAAAGPAPSLALSYDSQSVDGETSATNNQPSSLGDGWTMSAGGFIERGYAACAKDGDAYSSYGDQCWKSDNATMSLAGHSGQLIPTSDPTVWKLSSDDGSRVQHLTGTSAGCGVNGTYDNDCWRLTTTDGTQYYFGQNRLPGYTSGNAVTNSTWTVPVYGNDAGEPCHGSTFAASSCTQAWRWNLDYVVDVHGNAEALYYDAQTNSYKAGGTTVTSYTRGGEIDHIDYGIVNNQPYASNAASDKVIFGYDSYGRCNDTTHANCTTESASGFIATPAHPSAYPDVPFDQNCTTTCNGVATATLSPTFYTTSMLSTVTTQYFTGSAYSKVDSWTLSHSFPATGDSLSPTLWLTQVVHTGWTGSTSLAEPATVFSGETLQNRVWVHDGLQALNRFRLYEIQNPSGGKTTVGYSDPDCTASDVSTIIAHPESNTRSCFPAWWTPTVTPVQNAQEDLFHKYVVNSVVATPVTGGANSVVQETDYNYAGTPAWRYDNSPLTPSDWRTWSRYAGYDTVEVRVGDHNSPSQQQVTDYTYFRGLDGDRAAAAGGTKSVNVTGTTVADQLPFAGRVYETKTRLGVGGATLTDTVTMPTVVATTATDGTNKATIVEDASTVTTKPLSTGGSSTVTTTATYNATSGLPETTQTVTSDAGSSCTLNTYAPTNATVWLVGLVTEVRKVGTTCANANGAVYPAAAVSDVKSYYDGFTSLTATPTAGDVTWSRQATGYTGSTYDTAQWVDASKTTFDALGRSRITTAVGGRTSTTTYTPATRGPVTAQSTTSSAFTWAVSSATYNPEWGVETSATDENGNITSLSYDALGRRTQVWLPIHPKAANASTPSLAYAYVQSKTTPTAVTTTTLGITGTTDSVALYDGLGQLVQTQSAGTSGTVVSDTYFDSAGRAIAVNNPYTTTQTAPSTTLFVNSGLQNLPSRTLTTYDAASRATSIVTIGQGSVERNRVTNLYTGSDRIDTTPPTGSIPTVTFTNTLGQKTRLVEKPNGTTPYVNTIYGYDAQGNMTSMSGPSNQNWTWTFDALGRQIGSTDPDTGTSSTTYDDYGNVKTATDARGEQVAYFYDALNRVTAKFEGSDGSGALLNTWAYDTAAKGQLDSTSTYVGSTPGDSGKEYKSTVNSYNAAYQPLSTTLSIPSGAPAFGGNSYTTTYTYSRVGTLSSQVDPAEGGLAKETLRPVVNDLGQETSLSGTDDYLTKIAYSGIGQATEYDRGDGAGQTFQDSGYGYDQATGAIIAISDTSITGGVYTTTANRAYTRDASGNITKAANTSATATDTQCYHYGGTSEITDAWTPAGNDCTVAPTSTSLGGPAPYWVTYTVDPNTGNRTATTRHATSGTGTDVTDTYTYGSTAHVHAVTSVAHSQGGSSAYTYDASGNTATRPGQTLTYDANGKLSTVAVGSNTQSNIYDASGNLLIQTDGTAGTTLYAGDTQLHVAPGATVATATRTYTANGIPIAERTNQSGTSSLFWLSSDVDGTVDLEVNANTGAVTPRYFDPFGNSRGQSVSWSDALAFLNKPLSALTGITTIGARAYDTLLGKFLSVDPVLDPDKPTQNNGYTYAGNSPVTFKDPTGLKYDDYHPDGTGTGANAGHHDHGGYQEAGLQRREGHQGYSGTVTKANPPVAPVKKQNSGWNWGGFWANAATIAAIVVVVVVVVVVVACVVASGGICGAVLAGAAALAEGAVDVGAGLGAEAAVDAGVTGLEVAGEAGADAGAEGLATAAESGGDAAVEAGESAETSASESASEPVRGTNARGETTSRSTFRKGATDKAWDEAADGPKGGKLCPTCGKEVFSKPGSGKAMDWDRSHFPSWTNRLFTNPTREEVINEYNEGVKLECIACNRGAGNNDSRFNIP